MKLNDQALRLWRAIKARMEELDVGTDHPNVAPLVSEYRIAVRREHRRANLGRCLSPPLAELLQNYLDFAPIWSVAPALTGCDDGRRILRLAPTDRIKVAIAAYDAWAEPGWTGIECDGLRRVVSDLLRKLPLSEADAVALAEAATRKRFVTITRTPNRAVLTALERHVLAHGLSPELRRALEGLSARMSELVSDW